VPNRLVESTTVDLLLNNASTTDPHGSNIG
jgi:hypothetical protein